jgi:hypothetical protein
MDRYPGPLPVVGLTQRTTPRRPLAAGNDLPGSNVNAPTAESGRLRHLAVIIRPDRRPSVSRPTGSGPRRRRPTTGTYVAVHLYTVAGTRPALHAEAHPIEHSQRSDCRARRRDPNNTVV